MFSKLVWFKLWFGSIYFFSLPSGDSQMAEVTRKPEAFWEMLFGNPSYYPWAVTPSQCHCFWPVHRSCNSWVYRARWFLWGQWRIKSVRPPENGQLLFKFISQLMKKNTKCGFSKLFQDNLDIWFLCEYSWLLNAYTNSKFFDYCVSLQAWSESKHFTSMWPLK